MVLPDGEAVLGLDAFLRNAGPDDFGEPVDVDGVHIELRLDRLAHGGSPWLRAEDADLERGLFRVNALPLHLLDDGEHVRRRDHDDVGLEVGDELDLSLGHAARHRNHQLFRAVMRAQAAGEQSVAIRDVDDITGAAARCADRARHDRRPRFDVVARVTDNGGPAGRAGRRVNANDLLARHREHAERIVIAKVGFGGERKFSQIGQGAQIVRVHAGRVKRGTVVRDAVVGAAQGRSHALELQRLELVTARRFDRLQIRRRRLLHGGDLTSSLLNRRCGP